MKIFIDVNIFIDVMTKRQGWSASLRVLNLARESPQMEACASALTLPLLYFFRRRIADEATARRDARIILEHIRLVPLNEAILNAALVSLGNDFEDNIQIASAESIAVTHHTQQKGFSGFADFSTRTGGMAPVAGSYNSRG